VYIKKYCIGKCLYQKSKIKINKKVKAIWPKAGKGRSETKMKKQKDDKKRALHITGRYMLRGLKAPRAPFG
jgi:hypothetical protein